MVTQRKVLNYYVNSLENASDLLKDILEGIEYFNSNQSVTAVCYEADLVITTVDKLKEDYREIVEKSAYLSESDKDKAAEKYALHHSFNSCEHTFLDGVEWARLYK